MPRSTCVHRRRISFFHLAERAGDSAKSRLSISFSATNARNTGGRSNASDTTFSAVMFMPECYLLCFLNQVRCCLEERQGQRTPSRGRSAASLPFRSCVLPRGKSSPLCTRIMSQRIQQQNSWTNSEIVIDHFVSIIYNNELIKFSPCLAAGSLKTSQASCHRKVRNTSERRQEALLDRLR